MDDSQNTPDAVGSDLTLEHVPAQEVEIVAEQDGAGSDADLPEGTEEPSQDPAETLTIVRAALHEAEQRAEQAHQSYLRAVADLDNYRKRMRREQSTIASRAEGRAVTSMLPVLDSFDAALGIEVSSDQEQNVLSGINATYELMLSTLQNHGLEIVPTAGQDFSPDIHQPINAPPEGDGAVIVSNEVRRGYQLKGQLLRPALVLVSRRGESE